MADNAPVWHIIPKCSIITTKTTGNLQNLFRIYACHKAPLLTLTDCLSLFSILLPRAPDAGMKLPVMWDENSWRRLTGSQPKGREAVPPRSRGTELPTDASSALGIKCRELLCRFAHRFSFSWSSLICTRLHSLGICAGSSEPWEESREGRAWDISGTTMPWYPPPPQTLHDSSHRNSCQMVADLN